MKIINYNRISEFPIETNFSLDNDSNYFLKSETSPQLSSYKLNGLAIYNTIKDNVLTANFNFPGKWKFSDIVKMDKDAITDLSSAVTYEWCEENLLNLLDNLSSQLFNSDNNKLKLPSYVGQVIITNTLDTDAKVKNIYGGKKWKQIKGRFLLGTGPTNPKTDITSGTNATNYGHSNFGDLNVTRAGKMGGAKEVTLQAKNIPSHSHRVNDCSWERLPQAQIIMSAHAEGEGTYGVIPTGHNPADGKLMGHRNRKDGHKHTHGNYADPSSTVVVNEVTGSGNISKSFTFTPKATVSNVESYNKLIAHDNMPPYIVEYIWERIE